MSTQQSEFRLGWKTLTAATFGTALGASPIPFNAIGPFTKPIAAEFGWGRGDIQQALLWFTLAVVLVVPLIGTLVDRLGVRRVALFSLAGFGLSFAALGLTTDSLPVFFGLWALLGLLGAGSTPITWTRGVNSWFSKHRGLALALCLTGTGLTGALMPTIATVLIAELGWRWAFAAIACLPLFIALPIAIAFFREPSDIASPNQALPPPRELTGMTLGQAAQTRAFWIMAAVFFAVSIGVGGTITNIQPLLTDKGFTPERAAAIAGAIGLSVMFGRLLAGWLMDHFWAPLIAMVMFALPAISCWILAGGEITPTSAVLAAVLIGLAAGAESDLIAFLSARYYGLRHYGAIYGVQYAAFGLGAGISPMLFGRVFDQTGSYTPILHVAGVLFLLAAIAILLIGRYPDQAQVNA